MVNRLDVPAICAESWFGPPHAKLTAFASIVEVPLIGNSNEDYPVDFDNLNWAHSII
jgi:hypothetical protein